MVAGISFAVFVLLFFISLTVFFARMAWLQWFHPERAPQIRMTRSANPTVIRGHARGILPFVGFPVFLTVLIVAASVSSALTGTANTVAVLIAGACIPAFLLSLAAHATVAWFNWPKFLAPPHLRDETGSVTEWRRHRRGLRIALRDAAQRDSPGRHSDAR